MLADGTLIDPPDLEISAGGRRVRVAGGQHKSRPYYEHPKVLREAVMALGRGPGLPVYATEEERHRAALDYTVGGDHASKILLPAKLENGNIVHAVRFEDPSCPHMDAWLLNILVPVGVNTYHQTFLCYRDSITNSASSPSYSALARTGADWPRPYNLSPDEHTAWQTLINAGCPEPVVAVGSTPHTARKAVKRFVERARQHEELDHVYIPDLRDPSNPRWLKLERVYSNWTSESHSDMAAVVNAGPLVEQLIDCTAKMQQLLANLGVTVQAMPTEASWFAAAGGDVAAINVSVHPENGVDVVDHQHVVYLHLLSGAVHVACSHDRNTRNEAGEAYEVAKFKAELTGQADELLAFAQEYVRRNGSDKAQAIRDARLEDSGS